MTESNPRFPVCIHRLRGAYFARVENVPGCVARGETEVEAVENLRAALRTFLRVGQVLATDRPVVRLEIAP